MIVMGGVDSTSHGEPLTASAAGAAHDYNEFS